MEVSATKRSTLWRCVGETGAVFKEDTKGDLKGQSRS